MSHAVSDAETLRARAGRGAVHSITSSPMERSYMQVAAAAAPFVDYRKEAAVFDARTMAHPVVAPRGAPRSARLSEGDITPAADAPLVSVSTEVDWAGNYARGSSRKHVAPPSEVRMPDVGYSLDCSGCVCFGRCALQSLSAGLSPRTERASHNELKHYEKDIRFSSADPDATGRPLGVATYQVRSA